MCWLPARPFPFFFQAEAGIRDLTVTGVQTCALPIYLGVIPYEEAIRPRLAVVSPDLDIASQERRLHAPVQAANRRAGEQDRVLDLCVLDRAARSEERRVGKGGSAELSAGRLERRAFG